MYNYQSLTLCISEPIKYTKLVFSAILAVEISFCMLQQQPARIPYVLEHAMSNKPFDMQCNVNVVCSSWIMFHESWLTSDVWCVILCSWLSVRDSRWMYYRLPICVNTVLGKSLHRSLLYCKTHVGMDEVLYTYHHIYILVCVLFTFLFFSFFLFSCRA